MSNLIPRPGTSPSGPDRGIQTVQVRDLGSSAQVIQPGDGGDEIDLREIWRALRRRKKIVGVTAGAVILLAGFVTCYQRIFRPVYQGSFSLLITDPISNEGQRGGAAAAAASGTMYNGRCND